MLKILSKALGLLLVMTFLTGIAYPLAVTGLAKLFFSNQANGSMIERNGTPVGSALIGQNFSGPGYFHSRPSAAGPMGYDATASAGSNLGPTNKTHWEKVAQEAAQVRRANNLDKSAQVPADLVTASASGLDPHISPEAALLQAARVAETRRMDEGVVKKLISQHTEGRQLGIWGEPRVNVLLLNLALDGEHYGQR